MTKFLGIMMWCSAVAGILIAMASTIIVLFFPYPASYDTAGSQPGLFEPVAKFIEVVFPSTPYVAGIAIMTAVQRLGTADISTVSAYLRHSSPALLGIASLLIYWWLLEVFGAAGAVLKLL